ncbi:hypothetical protein NE237_002317 [Protea cynaroides]|uniref:Uncharacterized protein n=1 Tax=Protea cynaroides TaxID=273540 RepID=A0A9Q0KVV2_9MAGN|nr:hypothetical protein NE237_002317 [Protea cynaroides]
MSWINASRDTVFHLLALNCHSKVFNDLLLKLPLDDLMMMRNFDGDTTLHEAARVGCLEIATLMLQKEANLIIARNKLGETPIFAAAAFGQKKMLRSLSEKPDCGNGLRRDDGSTILHAAVIGEFYGIFLHYSNLTFYGSCSTYVTCHHHVYFLLH